MSLALIGLRVSEEMFENVDEAGWTPDMGTL